MHHHVRRPNRAERVHIHTALPVDTEDHALAVLAFCVRTRRAVVVEEAVQSRSIDRDVVAVQHPEPQCVAIPSQTAAVVWIVQRGIPRVRTVCCVRNRLVVSADFSRLRYRGMMLTVSLSG